MRAAVAAALNLVVVACFVVLAILTGSTAGRIIFVVSALCAVYLAASNLRGTLRGR